MTREYLCIDLFKFNDLLAEGQGISTFRVLNYIINIAYAEGSNEVAFKYNELADILGYGVRCIGESVRYLCKLGILTKTERHKFVINKEFLNVTTAGQAF